MLALSCSESQDDVHPEYRKITESVYSSATIQPDSMYAVYSAVAGILEGNLVEEGDLVVKGQELIKIENSTPQLNIENAKLALELAKSNYKGGSAVLVELENDLQSARIQHLDDSLNYRRAVRLWKQHIGSKAQLEKAKIAYNVSGNQVQALKNRLKRTRLDLRTKYEQAQVNYQNSLLQEGDFTVRSEISGKVYELVKRPGESVTSMEPIAFPWK